MHLKSSKLLAIVSLLAFSSAVLGAGEFSELVFSGFVELSTEASGEENVDFSKIEVLLTTEDDKIVERTMCSSNGFFLLPVYDKKSYVVKVNPPQESTFEPNRIAIDLNNKSPEEIKTLAEQSLLFKFVGFSIKGSIGIENSETGPNNLLIGLYDSKNKLLAEEKTVHGNFKFDKILTGSYTIKLQEKQSGYYWDNSKNSIKCEISWKSGQSCQGKIQISGFSVKGSFLNYNPSVKNNQVFLYSETAVKTQCNKPEIKNHPLASKNKAYLCYSSLDEKGGFSFENVPRGTYFVQINSDPESKIEITPQLYDFKVENTPVNLDNVFKINKFSLKGRVVDGQGKGIEGVKIILDGDEKGISDKNGYYYLEKITSGSYTIEGQHDHLFFEPLSNLQLSPTVETIKDLVLTYIHLCGQVSLSDNPNDNEFKNAKVTIYLEKQGEKRSVNPENGQYCFEVLPGRYNIYPVVTNLGNSNIKQESLLYPRSHDIQVTNEPLLNVNFNRPRLIIKGSLVPLPDTKAEQLSKTKVYIYSKNKNWSEKALIKDNHFEFINVLPGNYEIKIENHNLCWEEESKTVELTSGNLSNINFKQNGFAFKYKTSRPVMVQITGPGVDAFVTQLETNKDRYCVKRSGNFELTPDNCFQFSVQNFTASTDDDNGVFFDPVAFYVKGQVFVNEAIGKNLKNITLQKFIEKNILLNTTIKTAGATEEKLLLLESEGTENGHAKFSYSIYVKPDSLVTIEPKIRQKTQGSNDQILQNLLFNPQKLSFNIHDNCLIEKPENKLEIRQGVIYHGKVTQQISDWKLLIHFDDAKSELVQAIDVKGTEFRVGPFVDLHKYKISAEKSGYKFDANIVEDGYNVYSVTFNAQKLSHLELKIVDENSKPIPGSLIFISSTSKKNFLKMNNYTDEKGIFRTQNLVKGEYLIKAVLKEYLFEPGQITVNIEDGEHKNMEIKGKRVAFSMFGSIINLNGQGCAGLTVEANPIDSSATSETAVTDSQGNYRIRGLVPQTNYKITVQASNSYSSIKPSEVIIKAEARDIQATQFIGFERKTSYSIGGLVQFDETYTKQEIDQIDSIIVKLIRDENVVETVVVKSLRYFEFKNTLPGNYKVVTQIKRAGNAIPTEFTQEISSASFEQSNVVGADVLISKESAKKSESTSKSSFFGPILMLAVIFLLLNLESVLRWYKAYSSKKRD